MSRFNKLRFTCSNKTVLDRLDKLGEHHDQELQKTKETITSENATLQKFDDQMKTIVDEHANHNNCNAGCIDRLKVIEKDKNDAQKSAHACFTIAFDNLDVQVRRKNMTMTAQNDDFHWVNHRMIVNRVSGYQPVARKPRPSLNEVPNIKFMPTLQDQERQRFNYIILTSRFVVEYFKILEPFKDVCIWHIPHKYTKEMSTKSKKVGINDNTSERSKSSTHNLSSELKRVTFKKSDICLLNNQQTLKKSDNFAC